MRWTIHRHFKGNLYLEIGSGLHSETKEPVVIYRCLYQNDLGQTWVRPEPSFHGVTPEGIARFNPVATLHAILPGSIHSLPEELRPKDPIPEHASLHTLTLGEHGPTSCLVSAHGNPGQIKVLSIRTASHLQRQGHATTLLRAFMGLALHHSNAHGHGLRFTIDARTPAGLLSACGFHPSTASSEFESSGP